MSEGRILFNNYLVNDSTSKYWLFFSDSFGSYSAITINDASGNPITGYVSGRTEINFTFDYTGNTQGGRTPNTDANYSAIAIGYGIAQYVIKTGTINSGSSNDIYLYTELDWNRPDLCFCITSGNSYGQMLYWNNSAWTYTSSGISWDENNNTLNLSLLQLNTSLSNGYDAPGLFRWNNNELTAELGLTQNVTLQLGQETHMLVKNQSGSNIPDGTVVMYDGTVGASGRIKVVPAIANGTYPSIYIIGITTENINNGDDGFVTVYGKVRGINTTGQTEAWNEGDILWADPSRPGGLTNIEPLSPNLKVSMACVIYPDKNNGSIFVRPTLGSRLQDIYDVKLSSVTNGDLLIYSGGSWINSSYTPEYDTLGFVIDNGSNLITTGSKGYRMIDYNFVITGWTILSSNSGTCQVNILKSNYSDYPSFTGITGGNYPTLTNQLKNTDVILSDWTTSFTSGDLLEFYINSISNITKLYFFFKIKKT